MWVVDRRSFNRGLVLALGFFALLLLIFAPVYGTTPDGRALNGLQYADDLFNRLSKGSSNFIPRLREAVGEARGQRIAVEIRLDTPERVALAHRLLGMAGQQVERSGDRLALQADLGEWMMRVLDDAEAMYANQGERVRNRYGIDERQALETWWHVLKQTDKALKKARQVPQADLVHSVKNRAVETAYNFYGIPAEDVREAWPVLTGLLLFYLAYTIWWGFAIYFLFEGLGLTVKKAGAKKEV